jgi:hypothetical protein
LAGAGCRGAGCGITGTLLCGAAGIAGTPVFAGPDAGADFAGAFWRSNTLPEEAAPRVAKIAKVSDVIMKIAAASVVAFESSVADPRGPNAVCDPMPPKAPARSAALPLCNSTTIIKNKQTMTWMNVKRIVMRILANGSALYIGVKPAATRLQYKLKA